MRIWSERGCCDDLWRDCQMADQNGFWRWKRRLSLASRTKGAISAAWFIWLLLHSATFSNTHSWWWQQQMGTTTVYKLNITSMAAMTATVTVLQRVAEYSSGARIFGKRLQSRARDFRTEQQRCVCCTSGSFTYLNSWPAQTAKEQLTELRVFNKMASSANKSYFYTFLSREACDVLPW